MAKLTKTAKLAFDTAFSEAELNFKGCRKITLDRGVAESHASNLRSAIDNLLAISSRNTEAAKSAGRYKAELARYEEYLS
jgi:hypothetical protein